ncbi:MAG TPA: hypothetical protein PKA27_15620 [Fimbriimonadaceae bacterium]|nr:hypothetical protein [Fimbriimonadaceae bacterium]
MNVLHLVLILVITIMEVVLAFKSSLVPSQDRWLMLCGHIAAGVAIVASLLVPTHMQLATVLVGAILFSLIFVRIVRAIPADAANDETRILVKDLNAWYEEEQRK